MSSARILVAQQPDAVPQTISALDGYDLVVVFTLRQARQKLRDEKIDLFLIGIHFDDSQAIELVNAIRMDATEIDKPIVLIRMISTPHEALLRRTVEAIKKMHKLSDYLEFAGDPLASKKIREAVEQYLPASKILPYKQ